MDHSEKIRSAWIRSTKGLAKRPHLGKVTRTIKASITEGLTCEVEEDGFHFTADSPEVAGGNEQGATPITYLAGALASCLAIGYRQCLAARELPVDRIEVQVTATTDACAPLGLDGSVLGYDGPVTYAVHVESPADEGAVQAALDWVEAHSPLTNILRQPVELRRELHLTHTGN